MSLVEDARRLEQAAEGLANILTGCLGYLPEGAQAAALERLAAYEPCADHPGRIVAALEAAERVVRIHDENSRVVWDSPVFHEIDVLGDTLRGEEYTL